MRKLLGLLLAFILLFNPAYAGFFGVGGFGGFFGAAFELSSISGLVVQLEAASANVTLEDTDQVIQWTDLSGNGNHLTTTSASASRPTYDATGGANGQPSIYFDGTNDYLRGTISAFSNNEATVFVVAEYAAGDTSQMPFELTNSGTLNTGIQAQLYLTNGTYARVYHDATSSSITQTRALPISTFVSTIVYDGNTDGDASDQTLSLYEDGIWKGTQTSVGNWRYGAPSEFHIGSKSSSTYYAKGNISAIIVYEKALSTSERVQVERYLNAKFATISTKPNWIIQGDSISEAPNAQNQIAWSDQLAAAHSELDFSNVATSGDTCANIEANGINEIRQKVNSQVANNVIIFCGTNDINAGTSAADTFADMDSICDQVIALDHVNQCYMATAIQRSGAYDTVRDDFNDLVVANGTYPVIDLAALTQFDANGDENDTDYYVDTIHPTTAGYDLIAAEVESVLNSTAVQDTFLARLTTSEYLWEADFGKTLETGVKFWTDQINSLLLDKLNTAEQPTPTTSANFNNQSVLNFDYTATQGMDASILAADLTTKDQMTMFLVLDVDGHVGTNGVVAEVSNGAFTNTVCNITIVDAGTTIRARCKNGVNAWISANWTTSTTFSATALTLVYDGTGGAGDISLYECRSQRANATDATGGFNVANNDIFIMQAANDNQHTGGNVATYAIDDDAWTTAQLNNAVAIAHEKYGVCN